MEKTGVVVEIKDGYAFVNIERDSACGDNCAACGLCSNREMTVKIKNVKGFVVGDEVMLKTDDKKFLKGSAIGYLLMTALLIIGGLVGSIVGGEWTAFFGALVMIGVGVVILRKFFTRKLDVEAEKITR